MIYAESSKLGKDYIPKGWCSLKQAGDYDKDFWGRTRDICTECRDKAGLLGIIAHLDSIRTENGR